MSFEISNVNTMREAMLYDRLPSDAARCNICQWRCRINPGKYGACETRLNENGTLCSLIYGEVSSVAVDPIEKKPLFHFHPGSQVFSLGTWGCSFHCRHCQNWQISYARHQGGVWMVEGSQVSGGERLIPEESVDLARRHGCAGIAWTYNEPSIWLEYTLDGARLARSQGLYTAYVTNGFITPEALDTIGPYLDAYRVDVKGFSDSAYSRLARIPKGRWQGILDVAVRARQRWNMHVEVVTNVVPGHNDDEGQIRAIAEWIRDSLGPETPWHITRFFPHAELSDVAPTPVETLRQARQIGREAGLHFVYLGNVADDAGEDTYCPGCHKKVIQRNGYHARILSVSPGGKCGHCGANLNVRGI
ncbi:MAG: AmmeMemoRadiSam system radical SAM enzyme [Dehalococcoidales bacterium]|nr:AmmeMemoRadiSam system radical SAM enzyme [Dehalococcoidales bacterium]